VSATLHWAHGGELRGLIEPLREVLGAVSWRIFFFLEKHVALFPYFSCRLNFCVHCLAVFRHMVFADGFFFPIKEFCLFTNPGHLD
jgi:hypothetical protein